MLNLKLPIATVSSTNDMNAFIESWSKFYGYGKDSLYKENIIEAQLSEYNLLKLYEWKNGSELSELKLKSFNEHILVNLNRINKLRLEPSIRKDEFLKEFQSIKGAVWKIFLLHILKPHQFPIYDQHIHRAYNYMHGLPIEAVTNDIKQEHKIDFYFEYYLPFVKSINVSDLKKMDEAFFAFGKLLNTQGYKDIVLRGAPNLN